MTILVPIMLFGWIPLSIYFFSNLKPQYAVLASVVGGWLFLPMTGYDLPGLPEYNKNMAIALGLILGGEISGQRHWQKFTLRIYDIPMLIWCICPIVTSLSNNLGVYDGLSISFHNVVTWGVPYAAGRLYFTDIKDLQKLCVGIVIGGLIYVPLCLYEVRMSPQLSNMFYGFSPYSFFAQAIRYGGFRPVVFMQHGLMVSLWMAVSTVTAYWMWRSRAVIRIPGFKYFDLSVLVLLLVMTTVLCKSINGLVSMIVGGVSYTAYRNINSTNILILLLLFIPFFLVVRITGVVEVSQIKQIAEMMVDAERVQSLVFRLDQEDALRERAKERMFLGWGGYNRGRVVDAEKGTDINIIDSLWLITYSTFGLLGLASLYGGMLMGPLCVLHLVQIKKVKVGLLTVSPIVLALVVILFMIDSLLNSMVMPVYIMVSGALVSFVLQLQ